MGSNRLAKTRLNVASYSTLSHSFIELFYISDQIIIYIMVNGCCLIVVAVVNVDGMHCIVVYNDTAQYHIDVCMYLSLSLYVSLCVCVCV